MKVDGYLDHPFVSSDIAPEHDQPCAAARHTQFAGIRGADDGRKGWEGLDRDLSLLGWESARRVVLIRRALHGEITLQHTDDRE